MFTLLSAACHTTQSLRPPFDADDLATISERGDVQVVRKDGRTVQLLSPGEWHLEGDSLLGYREPPEAGLPADVVIPISEIESIRVRGDSDDELSTAEALILVGAGIGVAFFIFLLAYLPTDT